MMTIDRMMQVLGDSAQLMNPQDVEVTDIVIDSRKVTPGSLYVCLVGSKVDGHSFASAAVRAGAVALLVEKIMDRVTVPQIVVPDTRLAWSQLCAAWFDYPAKQLRLVGITGTNGKTTTSTLVKGMLEYAGYKVGLMGTVANLIGAEKLPQSMTTPDPMELHGLLRQMVDAGCDFCVMEVSAHALALRKVVGLKYEVAVFTNLTQDHLDDFKTMENYAAAKALLFSDDMARCAVVNGDDPASATMLAGYHGPVIRYGVLPTNDVCARNREESLEGIHYQLCTAGARIEMQLQLGGSFNVYNSLAAAAVGMQLGLSQQMVAEALAKQPNVDGRVQRVETHTDYVVIVDYAHTPDGLESILKSLRPHTKGELICVFGCGGDRDRTKRPIMGEIAGRLADRIYVTSDNPRTEVPEKIVAEIVAGVPSGVDCVVIVDRKQAIEAALDSAKAGDVILIAGKGHETYQDIMGVKHHFDDREVVREHLGL